MEYSLRADISPEYLEFLKGPDSDFDDFGIAAAYVSWEYFC